MGEYTGVITDLVMRFHPEDKLEAAALAWLQFECWKPKGGWKSEHGWEWRADVDGLSVRHHGESGENVTEPVFDHPLQSYSRRGFFLRGRSGYFDLEEGPRITEIGPHLYRLNCEGSLKNYGGEVDVWIDFLDRFAVEGTFSHRYEHNDHWIKVLWTRGLRSSWTLEGNRDRPPGVHEGDDP